MLLHFQFDIQHYWPSSGSASFSCHQTESEFSYLLSQLYLRICYLLV